MEKKRSGKKEQKKNDGTNNAEKKPQTADHRIV